MRVGIITDSIDNQPAGIGIYTENLVTNLLMIDHVNEYALIHGQRSAHPLYKHQQVAEIRYPTMPKVPRMLQDSIFLALTREKFDLVHKPNPTGFLLPVPFPTVITLHDLTTLYSASISSLQRFLYYQAVKSTINKVGAVIVDSEATKKDLLRFFSIPKNKIKVIYLGVDKDFKEIRKKNPDVSPSILFVGTFEPKKNIPTIVQAFDYLKRHVSFNLKLILAGKPGWDYNQIIETIRRSPFSSDIITPGYVPKEDLIALYNAASVFVYPSAAEGFGLPVLEAMACGCPVIASRVSCLPEIIKNAGVLIPSGQPRALARAIINLITNQEKWQRMKSLGLSRAKEFSWVNCATKTLAVYNDLLSI